MINKINRRNLLKISAGLTGFIVASPLTQGLGRRVGSSTLLTEGTTHQTLSRHGNLKNSDIVMWSVMQVSDKQGFLNEVEVILNNNQYKSEIKYRSNDKFKLGPCKNLINLVYDHPSVYFNMHYLEDPGSYFAQLSPNAFQDKLAQIFANFELFGEGENILVAKCTNKFGPSALMEQTCNDAINGTLVTTNAKLDRLLQVNNLISGLLYRFLVENETGNPTKLQLIEYFNDIYSVSDNNSINFTTANISVKKI